MRVVEQSEVENRLRYRLLVSVKICGFALSVLVNRVNLDMLGDLIRREDLEKFIDLVEIVRGKDLPKFIEYMQNLPSYVRQ